MKKKNWYRTLSLADDQYIAEANPALVIHPNRSKVIVSLVAACACLALIFGSLWLFIPFDTTPPDVSRYAQSEYYEIIQKLNALTFQPPKYKNNAEKLWAGIKTFHMNFDAAGEAMPEDNLATDGTNQYQEITDNQVAGIVEADRIKRSDTHIYYLDDQTLRIFSIDKENTKEVGNYLIDGAFGEFYLSDDCKTITVVTQYYKKSDSNYDRYVGLIALDVSDPAKIVQKEEFTVSGAYMSSRKVDGSILLLTEFALYGQELDFDNESTFLPQIDEGNGSYSIPIDGIVFPENLSNMRYTVVM